jgi:enoyl-CoA hydratase
MQIREVDAPVMQGLKAIYVAGAAAIVDPALAPEQAFAATAARHTDGLGDRYRQVADRNRRQIRRPT